MIKRIFSTMIAVVMLTCLAVPVSASAATITLVIDGVRQSADVAPVVESGTTLVPLRLISETLGASVSWSGARRQATIQTAGYTVVFTIDSTTYTVNGADRTLNVAPKIINGRTLIPIRAFADAIGAAVDYNATTNTASIDYFTKMTGSIKISGSTTVQPIAQAAADKLISVNQGLSISVAGGGSGSGINDVTAGTVNIGMSSREFRANEMETLNVFAVANDAIAIIVHPSNPVKNLTKEQAQKIFMGDIKNWNEVGGSNAPIFVKTRETGSGTLSALTDLLLGSGNSVVSTATPFTSSQLIKIEVAKDVNAIGFDSIGYLDSTVKAVSLDGVSASSATVLDKSYALGRQIYVATKGRPTGTTAIFIDYLRSKDCQDKVVVAEGYIPLN